MELSSYLRGRQDRLKSPLFSLGRKVGYEQSCWNGSTRPSDISDVIEETRQA
jgi:hypothetical protein